MSVLNVFESVRAHYVGKYRDALCEYREKFDPAGPEVLVELQRDCAYPYRLYRVDLASGTTDPPNLTEVNPESHLSFDPLLTSHRGKPVEIRPMVWNGIEFDVSPVIEIDGPLQAWALKWLDPEETAEPDKDGFGNYIHSVTQPSARDGFMTISVDFGTSGVDCVSELLDLFVEFGAEQISVHSATVLENGIED